MISYTCPECEADMSSPASMAGQREACAACGAAVLVPAPRDDHEGAPTSGDSGVVLLERVATRGTRVSRRALWWIGGALAAVGALAALVIPMMGSGDAFEVVGYEVAAGEKQDRHTTIVVGVRGPVSLVTANGGKLVRLNVRDWHLLDSAGNVLATASALEGAPWGDKKTFNVEFRFDVKKGDTPRSIQFRETEPVRLAPMGRWARTAARDQQSASTEVQRAKVPETTPAAPPPPRVPPATQPKAGPATQVAKPPPTQVAEFRAFAGRFHRTLKDHLASPVRAPLEMTNLVLLVRMRCDDRYDTQLPSQDVGVIRIDLCKVSPAVWKNPYEKLPGAHDTTYTFEFRSKKGAWVLSSIRARDNQTEKRYVSLAAVIARLKAAAEAATRAKGP